MKIHELKILVTPNAKKNEILGENEGVLKIKIKAPPHDDLANEEIIVFLSEYLKVKKSKIKIKSGHHSRRKTIIYEK